MLRRPLSPAAATIWFQPSTFAARSGQYGLGLTMMPTSGGPPELASSIAYSPVQLSVAESFATITGFRSSTGNDPWEIAPGVYVPAFAGGDQQGCGGGERGQPPARRQRSASFMRSKVERNTLCGNRAWNRAAARCASS